ncbi:MAG: hypothetical protein ABJB10_20075 [Mesorhizobium sp.]
MRLQDQEHDILLARSRNAFLDAQAFGQREQFRCRLALELVQVDNDAGIRAATVFVVFVAVFGLRGLLLLLLLLLVMPRSARTRSAIAPALVTVVVLLAVFAAAFRIGRLAVLRFRRSVFRGRRRISLLLLLLLRRARRTLTRFRTGFGRTAFAVLVAFGGINRIGHRRTSWVPLNYGGLKNRG